MTSIENLADISEEKKGDVIIVRLMGRFDAISSPIAEKRLFEIINEGHHKVLLVMKGVNYLSSAGMRMLLSTTKKLRTLSGKVYISNVAVNVLDVLKMSGFDNILALYETEEEALKQF